MQDFAKLPEAERRSALAQCGVADDAAGDVEKMLLSLPHVHVTAVKVFVDGEDDIKEGDMVTIQVFVALTRASHADGGGAAPLGRASVQAFTPRYPHPLQEKWCDPAGPPHRAERRSWRLRREHVLWRTGMRTYRTRRSARRARGATKTSSS